MAFRFLCPPPPFHHEINRAGGLDRLTASSTSTARGRLPASLRWKLSAGFPLSRFPGVSGGKPEAAGRKTGILRRMASRRDCRPSRVSRARAESEDRRRWKIAAFPIHLVCGRRQDSFSPQIFNSTGKLGLNANVTWLIC